MVLKNPRRSGGPKSAEGKLVASKNALKTGTYSSLVVLPDENQKEFNQLVEQFNYDFHPSDVIETSLVRELAVITWKKLRLEKLEQDYFIKKQNAPITMDELIDCDLKFNQDRYDFWSEQTIYSGDELLKIIKLHNLLQPLARVGISVEQLHEIKLLDPYIYNSLVDGYRQVDPLADVEISDEELVNKTVRLPNQPQRFMTSIIFERYIARFGAVIWCADQQAAIDEAVVKIKQERLLKMMQSDGVRRANDDLSRSLIRTLAEFRKHHEWRMQHRVIDTEEE